MNGIARSLRTQSTRTIGVVVSDIRNSFSSSIVKAVEDVARINGYTVLICNSDETGQNEEVALQLFIERQVSGVIHCSAGANLDLLRVLQDKSIPLIDLDRRSGLENVDTVILDNHLGAAIAARHLIGRLTWVQDNFAARPSTLGKLMSLPDFTQRENRCDMCF
jgi:DNA-binding LacI/PurR family transcriptional regulator